MTSNATTPPPMDIWATPLMRPPPGVVPNFVNPESRAYLIRTGMGSSLAVMLLFVGLRLYTRGRLTRSFGVDDYLCILATATITTYAALILSFIDRPEGRHGWDIPLGEVLTNHYWLEATMASVFVYCWANMFAKLTLLVLYLRIFRPASIARWSIWVSIVTIVLFYLATFSGYMGLCVRAGVPLYQSITELTCANNTLKISKAQGWFGLISDVVILVVPLPLVWQLSLTRKRRIGVLSVFLTGLAACGVSAASLAKRYSLVEQGADRTWENAILFLYCMLELAIGVICSCMPVIAIVLKGFLASMNETWNSVRRYGTQLLTNNRSPPGSGGPASKIPSRSESLEEHELPEIPSANVSGIRTFIRKLGGGSNNGSTVEKTNNNNTVATIDTLKSIDQNYHVQLKKINDAESGSQGPPPSRGGQSSKSVNTAQGSRGTSKSTPSRR
ncbi:hypothetical protein V8F33_009526 [Rhypophila sp. PSN 637]